MSIDLVKLFFKKAQYTINLRKTMTSSFVKALKSFDLYLKVIKASLIGSPLLSESFDFNYYLKHCIPLIKIRILI